MTPLAAARETAFAGEVELRFPFCRDLVDDLKTEIPARHRRWAAQEKLWYVTEPHITAAVDLLLDHFPAAMVPPAYARPVRIVAPRPAPAVATDEQVEALRPPLPPRTDDSPILVSVTCPRCHTRHDQPIRVEAHSSAKAAEHAITPELVSVCPSCGALAVVAFLPALAAAQAQTSP